LLNEIDENTGGDQEIDLYKDEKSLLNVFSKVLKLSSKKGALNPLTKPELSRKASLANQKGQTKRTHLIKMAFENPELRSEILKKLAGSVNTQSFLQELLDSGDVTAPDEDYYGDASDFEGEDDPEQAAKDEYDRNMQDYLNTSSSTSGWGYTTINASDFPDGFDLQQGGSYGGDIVVWDSHSDAEEAAVKELVDMFEGDPGTVNVEKMIDNGFLKNDDDAKETYIDEDASNTAGDEHLLEQIFEEELDEIRETKDEAEETLDQVRATIAFYGDALKELKRAEGTVKKDLRARKIKGKPSRETKKWLDSWKKVFTAEADAEEYISDEWDKQIASLVPLSFSKNFVSKSTPDQYFLDAEEYIKQLIKLMGGHMKPLTNIKQTAEKAIAESDEKESNILGGEDSDKIEEWVRGNVEDNVKYYGSFFQYLLQEFGQSADSIISTTEIDLDYEGWAEFVVEHDGAGPTLNSWDGELYETRSFVWAVR
jgi:hypothetical protein